MILGPIIFNAVNLHLKIVNIFSKRNILLYYNIIIRFIYIN